LREGMQYVWEKERIRKHLVENFWKKNLDEKIILEWILKTG
jgi:hypothetical protein